MFDIRLEGKSPIYEQIFAKICSMIAAGKLLPNERLPAVREFAKQLCINPNTVHKAYAQLEQMGLIYSIPAKGSFVSERSEAVGALRKNALQSLSAAVVSAQKNGISYAEALEILDKNYSKGEEKND